MIWAERGILVRTVHGLLAVACLISYRREVGQVSPRKSGKKPKPKKTKPPKKK
jgi:hypothetical protein